jgi:type I restriction enzyme S subunit
MISHTNFRQDVPTVELAQVVEFLDNKRKPITEKDRVAGPYPYYGANGVQDYVTDWIFDEDLILLAEDGGHFENPDRGVAYKITGKTWVNNHAHVLRAKKVDIDYLKHVLINMDLMPYVNGATRLKLTKTSAEKIKIPLPPLAQQQRIAAILDKAAEIKAKRELAIAKLDELSIAIFEEAVSRSQTIEALGELCDVRDGTHDSPKYVAEGFPLITSKNIVDGKIDSSTANYINEEDYIEICKRSRVDHGDILMPMIGTIGNPVIVKELTPKFAIKNVALIKFKSNSPSNIYINAFLKSRHFYKYVNKLSRGGTQKFLGLGDIRKLPIPMLAKESEVEFCTRLQRTNMLREQTIMKLAKVNSLVASLQHQAFSKGFDA